MLSGYPSVPASLYCGLLLVSLSFGKRLEEAGIVPSMGMAGICPGQSAISESFVATLKVELAHPFAASLPAKRRGAPS